AVAATSNGGLTAGNVLALHGCEVVEHTTAGPGPEGTRPPGRGGVCTPRGREEPPMPRNTRDRTLRPVVQAFRSTTHEDEEWRAAARLAGIPVVDWMRSTLRAAAKALLAEHQGTRP